jgi:hypothetical protein
VKCCYKFGYTSHDITPRETVRLSPKCDREVTVYGYLRGANLRPGARVHIAGVGDYTIQVGVPHRRQSTGMEEGGHMVGCCMSHFT